MLITYYEDKFYLLKKHKYFLVIEGYEVVNNCPSKHYVGLYQVSSLQNRDRLARFLAKYSTRHICPIFFVKPWQWSSNRLFEQSW